MYELVDRPVCEQNRGVRLYVWAMRQWVRAALDGRCVCRVIGAAFDGSGAAKASAPFNAGMRTLCTNARIPLRFGAVDRTVITEHEAIVIGAAVAASLGRQGDVQAIARSLVFPDLAPALVEALTATMWAFAEADLSLFEGLHDR